MTMPADQTMPPALHAFLRGIVRVCFSATFRMRVLGTEHVPANGPVVFGSNHINNLDPIVIGASTVRQVHFMAKEELFKIRLIGRFLSLLGAFPVRRGGHDTAAVKRAIQIPQRGGCLVIFPEGHRSKDGVLGKGLPGVALIARKANAPVVPVAIDGSYRWWGRVTVRFGAPLYPQPDDTNETLLERLMSSIAVLLQEVPDR